MTVGWAMSLGMRSLGVEVCLISRRELPEHQQRDGCRSSEDEEKEGHLLTNRITGTGDSDPHIDRGHNQPERKEDPNASRNTGAGDQSPGRQAEREQGDTTGNNLEGMGHVNSERCTRFAPVRWGTAGWRRAEAECLDRWRRRG